MAYTAREIKFRGWYTGPIVKLMLLPTFNGPVNEIFNDPENDGRVVYMQYTGLKDKNGVDIYEGDIITIPAWRNARFKVVFEAGMFRAVEGERKISLATFKGEVRCEVIGNIYENPKLLEASE